MRPFRRLLPGCLVDRYLLKQMLRPLAISLGLVLSALLIERILRLMDMVATRGGPLDPVLTMAANLLPHYLGLALPAAFFLSVVLVVARLSEESEIDALLSSGLSLRRIVVPFLIIGLLLAALGTALFGYVQPFTRYGYRAALHDVTEAGFIGKVPAGAFIDLGDGITFHARETDPSGRRLSDIFIERTEPNGRTTTITARQGLLRDSGEAGQRVLVLLDGTHIEDKNGTTSVLHFDSRTVDYHALEKVKLFRPRGHDERELTLDELWRDAATETGPNPPPVLRAEFHDRLVRAASIIVLPLLAVPMGIAAKRRRRSAGVVLSALVLVLYNQILEVGSGLAATGAATPLIAQWLPFIAFSVATVWILLNRDRRAGVGPIEVALDWFEAGLERGRGLFKRRRSLP